jgi:hypothetical protein
MFVSCFNLILFLFCLSSFFFYFYAFIYFIFFFFLFQKKSRFPIGFIIKIIKKTFVFLFD